jgi:hypothetical protein
MNVTDAAPGRYPPRSLETFIELVRAVSALRD